MFKLNEASDEVIKVQRCLNALGEQLTVGVFDQQTKQAVMRFQASVGMPATGVCNKLTLMKLYHSGGLEGVLEKDLKKQKAVQPRGRSFSCYHTGDMGDIIYAMASLSYFDSVDLLLGPDQSTLRSQVDYRPHVGVTDTVYGFLEPLIRQQPYIRRVAYSTDKNEAEVDFTVFRTRINIANWRGLNLLDIQADVVGVDPKLVRPTRWLTVPKPAFQTPKVIISRSLKQHAQFPWEAIMHDILAYVDGAKSNLGFIGLDNEYNAFITEVGIDIPRFHTKDALVLAQAVDRAELIVCNSSFLQSVAEGLKKPYIMELPDFNHSKFTRSGVFHPKTPEEVPQEAFKHKLNRVIHVVSKRGSTNKLACLSWDRLYETGKIVPCHVWHTKRSSKDIGDQRAVPYFHDLIAEACKMADDDDVIMYTNDDIILTIETPEKLNNLSFNMAKSAFRLEFDKDLVKDLSMLDNGEVSLSRSLGRDVFVFTKRWWLDNSHLFPDYLIGATDWDYVLAILMRLIAGIEPTMENIAQELPQTEIEAGFALHGKHDPWWQNNLENPAHAHNKNLTRKFLTQMGLSQMQETTVIR